VKKLKSYIKIYGPPVLKAIKALEKMAVNIPEVCIMDPLLYSSYQTLSDDSEATSNYFGVNMPIERCSKIISKSGEHLGDYDFYFEWLDKPDDKQLYEFIQKIDKALTPLGCRYSITTK
jgi:hypothetical protein